MKRTDWKSDHPVLRGDTRAASTPRLALTRTEAAEAIGISLDSFERHVQPSLRCNYIGSRRVYEIEEIKKWLAENAVTPGS